MAAKNRPYEQFGSYILFKKLESDALGDLWRAARIEGPMLGPTVAVRRLTGGNRAALVESAAFAKSLVPLLTGTTFAKEQVIDVAGGVPFIAHDYSGGRSLRHVVNRARGGQGVSPNPIPLDQAMVIAEKVALSLTTTADLRYSGNRLSHGALIPQFIWIADDGEIRVAGQQLGKGIAASLADKNVAAEIGRYFPPEYAAGEATKTTDVFSMGAILHLLFTGNEPPDAATASAYTQAIRAAKTSTGQPLPDDIRALLEKSLALDPAARFATIGDMKQAISALAHSGKYSATTFNLAFYLSNLLKKEMEGEAIDREKEAKVSVAAYLEPVAATSAAAVPSFYPAADAAPAKKKPAVFIAIAAGVLAAAGAGAWIAMKPAAKPAAAASKAAAPAPAPRSPIAASAIAQPIVSTPDGMQPVTATTASTDPNAQKKAFEDAVNQKLAEEMMKLQRDYTKNLQAKQSSQAPVQQASASQTPVLGRVQPAPADEHAPSAAALDANRLSATRPEPQPAVAASQTAAPILQQQAAQQPAPAPVTAPAQAVREGDIVDVTELDRPLQPLNQIRVSYPPLALQQRVTTTVIVTTLIDEDGKVSDVKVLRGDNRFGFNESAIRAMRATRFTPPTKNGVRVKTWRPQPISFAP